MRLAIAAVAIAAAIAASGARAVEFVVTKTADTADGVCDADCSLREAISAANATLDADTVTIPPGTYVLSIPGDENVNAGGDLDVRQSTLLQGRRLDRTGDRRKRHRPRPRAALLRHDRAARHDAARRAPRRRQRLRHPKQRHRAAHAAPRAPDRQPLHRREPGPRQRRRHLRRLERAPRCLREPHRRQLRRALRRHRLDRHADADLRHDDPRQRSRRERRRRRRLRQLGGRELDDQRKPGGRPRTFGSLGAIHFYASTISGNDGWAIRSNEPVVTIDNTTVVDNDAYQALQALGPAASRSATRSS